jgi:acyl-CoA reductase-like NAD-dependent aldehyde dehydrogenase
MDAAHVIEKVAARADAWAALSDAEQARLLRACLQSFASVQEEWARTACATKGIDPSSNLAGEEWIASVAVSMRAIRAFAETLEGKHPPESIEVFQKGGRSFARAYPRSFVDRLMMPGHRVDLELDVPDGTPLESVHVGRESRQQPRPGLSLVLGAGNIDSILIFDLLDQLVRFRRVAVLKFNPVNAAIRSVMERALAPWIEWGALALVEGDASVGAELSVHPLVDHIHLTGSNASFDAMVWGTNEAEARDRRARDEPRIQASVSAELGAVTPVLVVPGAWSSADLRIHARLVAAMAAHNSSHNCNAAKLVVTARHWPQREAFLDELRQALAALPVRPAWYPGAAARWEDFRNEYPQAKEIAPRRAPRRPVEGALPWLFIPDVPLRRRELACRTEAFTPVLAECSVAAKTPEEFLERAVDPVNEEVFGTLSAAVLAPTHTPDEALETALAGLRYGSLCVNTWPGLAFGLGTPSWGAYPGHTLQDAGSGIGHVHMPLMLDDVRRSIVRAPFRPGRTAAFDPRHRRLLALGRAWASWEAKPTLGRFVKLAVPALLG